jgi:hypothetical protein
MRVRVDRPPPPSLRAPLRAPRRHLAFAVVIAATQAPTRVRRRRHLCQLPHALGRSREVVGVGRCGARRRGVEGERVEGPGGVRAWREGGGGVRGRALWRGWWITAESLPDLPRNAICLAGSTAHFRPAFEEGSPYC